MTNPDQLVAYARQIAVYRAYDNLENGLQPLDVLNAKFEHEQQEFAEAVASGDIWHMYHEAADLLYYAACIDMQIAYQTHAEPFSRVSWEKYREALRMRVPGINAVTFLEHAEKAALAKYTWRASAPGNKDEAHEIELIQAAIA